MSKVVAYFADQSVSFAKEERGAIAIMTALVFIILCGAAALSLDGARGYAVAERAARALDSAILATGRRIAKEGNTFDTKAFAQQYFTQQMGVLEAGTELETYQAINVSVDEDAGTVTGEVLAKVPTSFGKLLGVNTLDVRKNVTVQYGNQDLELSLMLDVTGSMNSSAGGGLTKLEALKASVANLANILMKAPGSGGGKVRVALAPYSSGVNAGVFSDAISNSTSTDGCVVERLTNKDNDAEPSFANGFLRSIDTANAELPSGTYGRYQCPPAEVLALTESKDDIINRVNSYAASGYTSGHMGVAWAWYMISEKWNSIFGHNAAASSDKNTVKAVILMTDGAYNTAYQGITGDDSTNSYQTAADLCTNMAAEGIRVFAVGFKLNSASARDSLRDCATNDDAGNVQFYEPNTPDELNAVYASIATKLSSLRIAE